MSQFEKTTIINELIQYLKAFTQSLESLPAYYPADVNVDQLHQTMRVKEYRPFVPLQPQVHRGHESFPVGESFQGDDFHQEWLTQAQLWEEGIGDDLTAYTSPSYMQEEWSFLRQHLKRAILLGHPGSGKSWVLRYEGLCVAREQLRILQDSHGSLDAFLFPFYLSLATLADELEQGDGDIYETLARMIQRYANLSETFVQWVKLWLVSHSSLLLLDGLEDVTEQRYLKVTQALQQLAAHPRCRIFLTSRIIGYRGIPFRLGYTAQEKELELLPFNREQVNRSIAAWNPAAQEDVRVLQETVQTAETLRPLVCLPLLLSFFCLVCRAQQTPPLKLTSLYEGILRVFLLKISSDDIYQLSEGKIEIVLNVLELIAWRSTSQSGFWPAYLLEQEVQEVITTTVQEQEAQEFFWDVSALLENLFVKGGILEKITLSEHSENEGRWAYRFASPSFCHYLVARYLTRERSPDWLLLAQKKVFDDPDWEEVFVFLAGCLPNPEPLLLALTEEATSTPPMILLAGRCFVEADRASVQPLLKKRIITQLRAVSFVVSDQQRKQIGTLLMQLYDSVSIERLRTLLWDEKSLLSVRCAVIWALGTLGRKEGVDDIALALWEYDKDDYGMVTDMHYLRCVAAWGVGRLASSSAVGELMQIVRVNETEEQVHLLCAVAWALGQLKDMQAVQALLALLQYKNVYVRVAAIWALGELRTGSVFDHVFAALYAEEVSVRNAAKQALITIGSSIVPALLVKLERPELEAEMGASIIRILGEIGDIQVVHSLLTVLNERSGDVRIYAIRALRQVGDTFAADTLLTIVGDKNEDKNVRMEAARALAAFGDSRLAPALFDYLRDQRDQYKYGLWPSEILRLLVKVADQSTVSFLLEVLQKQDTVVCRIAGDVLGRIGDENISSALMDILQDTQKNAHVRASSLRALREIERGKQWSGVWLKLLHDTNEEIQGEAIEALGELKDRDVLDHIRPFTSAKSTNVRIKAVEALGKIGGEEAFHLLCEMAKNVEEEKTVVVAVLEALEMIGGEGVWEIMHQMLLIDYNDRYVVYAAIKALERRRSSYSREILFDALHAQDEVTRWKTAEALGEIADGQIQVVEELERALRDEKKNVRLASARALGKIGHSQALTGLLMAVHDTDRDVSRAALFALGQIKSEQAKQGLYTALRYGDKATQETAALVLVRSGEIDAAEKLMPIIRDESGDTYTRVKGIRALCRLGDPMTMKDLLALLWNDDEIIRAETASSVLDLDISLLAHFLCQEYI